MTPDGSGNGGSGDRFSSVDEVRDAPHMTPPSEFFEVTGPMPSRMSRRLSTPLLVFGAALVGAGLLFAQAFPSLGYALPWAWSFLVGLAALGLAFLIRDAERQARPPYLKIDSDGIMLNRGREPLQWQSIERIADGGRTIYIETKSGQVVRVIVTDFSNPRQIVAHLKRLAMAHEVMFERREE